MYQIDVHSNHETTRDALYQLDKTIELLRKQKEHVFSVIVGYGSTGGSHKIKTAVIDCLNEKLLKHQVKGFIVGSELDIFNSNYQKLNDFQKKLVLDKLGRTHNPGEIIVFI